MLVRRYVSGWTARTFDEDHSQSGVFREGGSLQDLLSTLRSV